MPKISWLEMLIIRVGIISFISLVVFVACWFTSFGLRQYLPDDNPEIYVKWSGVTGIAVGFVVGLFAQARITPRFYLLSGKTVAVAYVLLMIMGIGFGMGVPVLLPVLGILVGAYLARRAMLLSLDQASFLPLLRQATIRTCLASCLALAGLWSLTAIRATQGLMTGMPNFTGNMTLSCVVFLICIVILAPALQAVFTKSIGRFVFSRSHA
jgi:hypothetical protein